MNAGILSEYFPALPLGMFLGLILSIYFRRRHWAALIWVPTLASFATVSWLILKPIVWLVGLRGPDAGWGGLQIIYLLPILAVCIAGVIACYFYRPKGQWNPRILAVAISLSAGALFCFNWRNGTNVTIQLTDTKGDPVNDVSLGYNNGPRTSGSGIIEFPLRRGQSIELHIAPTSRDSETLASWNLRFSPVREDSTKLEIHYSTSRQIGFEQSLHEGFTEIVPFSRNLSIPLTLAPDDLISPDPMGDKIRATFRSIEKESGPRGINYGYVCRNLTAVEFIPELIALARKDQTQQFSVTEGLKQIADTLSDLDLGSGKLEKVLAGRQSRPPAEIHKKILRLVVWAGLPNDTFPDDAVLLAQVRQKIVSHAKPIVAFCLDDPPPGMETMGLLAELGQVNRPLLPDFVQRLLAHPPEDMQVASSWSRVFFRIRATKGELKLLLDSPDPLLQATARDARNE